METFKVGQKIKYTKVGKFGWEDINEAKQAGLSIGEIVTVCEVNGDAIKIEESIADTWIHPSHFEKVN